MQSLTQYLKKVYNTRITHKTKELTQHFSNIAQKILDVPKQDKNQR